MNNNELKSRRYIVVCTYTTYLPNVGDVQTYICNIMHCRMMYVLVVWCLTGKPTFNWDDLCLAFFSGL